MRIIGCSLLYSKIVTLNTRSKMCLCAPETFRKGLMYVKIKILHSNYVIVFWAQKLTKLLAATAILPSRQHIHFPLTCPREWLISTIMGRKKVGD